MQNVEHIDKVENIDMCKEIYYKNAFEINKNAITLSKRNLKTCFDGKDVTKFQDHCGFLHYSTCFKEFCQVKILENLGQE